MTVQQSDRPRDTLGRPITEKGPQSLNESHISGDKTASRREIALRFDYRKGAELLHSRDFGRNRSHRESPSEEAQKHRGLESKQGSYGSHVRDTAPAYTSEAHQSTSRESEGLPQVTREQPPLAEVRLSASTPARVIDSVSRQVSSPEEVKKVSPERPAPTPHSIPAQAVEAKPVAQAPTIQPSLYSQESLAQRQQAPEMTPTMKRLVEIVNNSTLDRQIGSPIKNPILEFSDKDHEALKAMLTNPAVKQELLGYSDAQIKAGFEAVRPDRIKYLHEWLAMNHRNAVNYPGFARSMGGITPADTNRIGQVVGIALEVERKVSGL